MQEPVEPLTIVRPAPSAACEWATTKGGDDKIVAVHVDDPAFNHYSGNSQLPPHLMRELQRFFEDYKTLEKKAVRWRTSSGARTRCRSMRDAFALYRKEENKLRGWR